VLAGLVQVHEENLRNWSASQETAIADLRQKLRTFAEGPSHAAPDATAAPPAGEAAPAGPLVPLPAPGMESAVPQQATPVLAGAGVPSELGEAVVRVTAQSLNRLMSLAGESLVQARWLSPFATALLQLKKQQDHLAGLIDNLAHVAAARSG